MEIQHTQKNIVVEWISKDTLPVPPRSLVLSQYAGFGAYHTAQLTLIYGFLPVHPALPVNFEVPRITESLVTYIAHKSPLFFCPLLAQPHGVVIRSSHP